MIRKKNTARLRRSSFSTTLTFVVAFGTAANELARYVTDGHFRTAAEHDSSDPPFSRDC